MAELVLDDNWLLVLLIFPAATKPLDADTDTFCAHEQAGKQK
jgi:hypothetical protein